MSRPSRQLQYTYLSLAARRGVCILATSAILVLQQLPSCLGFISPLSSTSCHHRPREARDRQTPVRQCASSSTSPESPTAEPSLTSTPSMDILPIECHDDGDHHHYEHSATTMTTTTPRPTPGMPDSNDDDDDLDAKSALKSFQMDLQNLATDDPQKAQDALEIMWQLHEGGKHPTAAIQPDAACYHIVLEGWLDAGRVDEAEELLRHMGEQALRTGNAALEPTGWAYLSVAQGWANDSPTEPKGAFRAERLLRELHQQQHQYQQENEQRPQQRRQSPNPTAEPPSVQLWGVVLEAWCKRAGHVTEAIPRARGLLEEMEASYQQQQTNNATAPSLRANVTQVPPPNVLTYTSFIGGLARSKERDLARQAEAVLQRMRQHGVQPDMVAYTSVLNCWSKAVSRREREMAAVRSLKLLQEMERLYIKEEQYHVKPSLITYSTAIRAIGHSLDPDAASLAEGVVDRLYHLHRTGLIANLKPTTQTYNAVLHALSTAPGDGAQKLRNARRAEDILEGMMRRSRLTMLSNAEEEVGIERDVEPDVRTWAAVLRAWAQISDTTVAAENCQRVLDKLQHLRDTAMTTVRPNFVCYTTVMGAWGNSKHPNGSERMEEILMDMERSYEETLEADVRPNTISYVTAIDSFVRRNEPDAALRAQATVDRMLRLYANGIGHVRPTRTIFNCLINAYSKSKEKGAAQSAEKIFQWMEAQGRADELVRPDAVSICGVLNAWANQGTPEGAERALQIWHRMESLSTKERGFELSITMPNIVIKAIARAKDPEAVDKVERILLKLESDYYAGRSSLMPDVTTASSVINAAAYYAGSPDGRSLALETALRTFRKIKEWGQEPNNITYGTMLKAIANLLLPSDPQRNLMARQLFDQCCEQGYVDGFVLSQVRKASFKLYRELVDEPCGLGGPNSDTSISSVLRNIPSDWSANVVE